MHIMCLIIFEEKAEAQDQYPLSLKPVQKADDPVQDRYRSIGSVLQTISILRKKVYHQGTEQKLYITTSYVSFYNLQPSFAIFEHFYSSFASSRE